MISHCIAAHSSVCVWVAVFLLICIPFRAFSRYNVSAHNCGWFWCFPVCVELSACCSASSDVSCVVSPAGFLSATPRRAFVLLMHPSPIRLRQQSTAVHSVCLLCHWGVFGAQHFCCGADGFSPAAPLSSFACWCTLVGVPYIQYILTV